VVQKEMEGKGRRNSILTTVNLKSTRIGLEEQY
jgi:hypothetical protein